MKKIYTFLCAVLFTVAAMAQANHPAQIKGMPRLNITDNALQHAQAHKVTKAPLKAGEQVLPIDETDPVKLYTNEAYSWEGHYDYYFSFANSQDEFFFPMIFFDLYLPTDQGLEAGTYKMSEGTVDPNLMLMANYNDYIYYYYGYLAYEWADATITLTKGEEDNVWTVDFSATTTEDFTFKFSFTGELTVELDDFDPNDVEEEEDETSYMYEPAETTDFSVVFGVPEIGYLDSEGVLDIYLDSEVPNAEGLYTEAELYLNTNDTQPKADLYPVNYSGAANTFLSSKGGSMTSSKDYPCFIRHYDEIYIYNSWYIVAGQISVAYDADGKMALEGNVASYNGSNIHFTTKNATGINAVLADHTLSSTKKVLTDGQIQINCAGTYYNALGQRF